MTMSNENNNEMIEEVNNEIVEESVNSNVAEDAVNNDIINEAIANEAEGFAVENPEAVIEAILFAMGNSVEIKKLAEVIGRSLSETEDIVLKMKEKYNRDKKRGVSIIELDGAIQMCSKTEMYEHLVKIATTPKHYSLTDAVLETLSIVAYKQPVTRIEIEKIRGVNCDHAVNKLVEYGLIAEIGRLEAPGRPLLFGTTEEFLRSFGVKSLEELPMVTADRLEEFKKEAAEEIQLKLDI